MKIISKYKDFYDYLVQDNDADLTYIRNINIIDKYYDELFNKIKDISTPYFSQYYGYGGTYTKNKDLGELSFGNYIFGIYPYIYSQPVLYVHYNNLAWGGTECIRIIIGKNFTDETINSGDISGLINLAQYELNKLVDKQICKYAKVHFAKYYSTNKIIDMLKKYVWKIECKELFNKLNAPVFVKYYEKLFAGGSYWEYIYNWSHIFDHSKGYKHYITNICFNKLNENILKYWFDDLNNINTYNDIENFLWSIKQEPISNPDNKTKILSHGFDLKTSFRKM